MLWISKYVASGYKLAPRIWSAFVKGEAWRIFLENKKIYAARMRYFNSFWLYGQYFSFI